MTEEREPQKRVMVPAAEGLAQVAAEASRKGPPPVHLWNPPFCGAIDMEIRRDGSWFYLGTPIGRPALVKLFASILKREGEAYFLVTPVEKVGIRVLDAPFIAVDCTVEGAVDRTAEGRGEGQSLRFLTNVGDEVTAGPEHPIRFSFDATGQPSPYVMVRAGLEARIDRKTFYRLVEIASPGPHEGTEWLGLHSQGIFFPMAPMTNL